MPESPVPSLWEKSANTIRSFISLSDPSSEFIRRGEIAVKVFWRDLINEPYATGPGAKAFANAADSIAYIITNNGTGIGLIINDSGLILTEWEVVQEATSIAAVFRPKSVADLGKNLTISADILKTDPGNNLALLQLRHPPGGIRSVVFGDATKVHVGNQVFSIGLSTPKTLAYHEVTVKELNPTVLWSTEYSKRVRQAPIHSKLLAVGTEAPIGISGGPILNRYGAVIGIKVFFDPKTSLVYAIPANTIKAFLDTAATTETHTVDDIVSWSAMTLTDWRKKGILKQFDTNDDGVIDRIGIDSDLNKYVDAWIVDNNQDGIPEFIARDENKNGRHEKRAYDVNGDGTYETHYFDHNEDKIDDVIGTDVDGDGTVDVFAIIRRHGLGSTNIKSHLPPQSLLSR